MENEINNQDLNILKNNSKISARILSLIEIIDKMILNQFFLFYSQCIKKNKIEYYFSNNSDESKDWTYKINEAKRLSYNFYLKNESYKVDIKILSKEKLTEREKRCAEEYKKIVNNEIKYPFDVFGTVFFMEFTKTIFSQFPNTDITFLKKYIKKNLIVDFTEDIGFFESIYRIYQLRQVILHKADPKKPQINFHCKLLKKRNKFFEADFSLQKSFENLFLFLPINTINETKEYIKSQITNDVKCCHCGNLFETKNNSEIHCPKCNFEITLKDNNENIVPNEAKNNIKTAINNAINNAIKKIKNCIIDNNNVFARQVNDLLKIMEKTKFCQKHSLFYFIKIYNFIGETNFVYIRKILKTIFQDINIYKGKEKLNYKNITFEEIYKIFMLLININEIFRVNFIEIYEKLNRAIENQEKYKNLEKELKNKKNQIKSNDKKLTVNKKDEEILKKQRKLKIERKKILYKINKMKIKDKNVNLVRDNIAHSNLFFYNINGEKTNNENEKQNFISSYNINNTFGSYLNHMLFFYNKSYNKIKCKELLKKNIYKYKRMLLKQLSQLLLKKDYLFLVVPKESKDKQGNILAKIEIQKLGISNENKNTKEAFKNAIKAKIKDILDSQNKENKIYTKKLKIGGKDIHGITVMKYEHYYYLKNILIKELNKVKIEDLKFQDKEDLAKKYEKRLDFEKKNDKI